MTTNQRIEEAGAFVRARGFDGRFDCAMVLGTGLGKLVDDLTDVVSLPYTQIPHFPESGVSGHAGQLIAGRIDRKRVLIFQGRAHYYETGDAGAMRVPIGLVAALGIPIVILTNAAGSTKLDFRPSSLVSITDHVNFSGMSPLFKDRSEGRFVSMTNAYDERLRKKLKLAAIAAGVTLHEGVYMWFAGPSFETPAEIRMARTLGADLVGMSTVPEVILARYHGLKVCAISVVTNMAAGIGGASPSHGETKDVATGASAGLRRLIRTFVGAIDDTSA
ncbi:MAG TPA: purine-nucleoside phosphorylase [Salinarimonas sp.]|jgi:purine-nucleoside phosphorylase|nr:purine-nucleoside phosphorylase [Salinarimonas sp.]